ncbi:MAG: molybdenum cofactor biosynthesis protein B [Terrabacter sp.]
MSDGFGAGRSAVVVTASTRAAAGVYEDKSGPVIVERLRAWGFEVGDPVVVPDGDELGRALRVALAGEPALVLTSGGTGLTPTDVTPEQTAPLLDRLVPGVAEAIRAAGVAKGVPTAMLSRGLVGVAGRTFVANLPGSRGGVVDALDVLEPVLGHALDQVPGSDH